MMTTGYRKRTGECLLKGGKIGVRRERIKKSKGDTHNQFMHFFCPGTMTTRAESINSDLQRGLDRRLRHNNIEHRTEPVSH